MSNIVDLMTARLLADAGIGSGMRVLDAGCGHGAVSMMIAELVGSHGEVVGIDSQQLPLTLAAQRAREAGFPNVVFNVEDLNALPSTYRDFDAVVERRVLMYQADPVHALTSLANVLRPGGLLVLQENDRTMTPASHPSLPLHDRVHNWIWETVEREGANTHIGFDLQAIVSAAGFTVQHMRAEAVVQTPDMSYGTHEIVRAILPRIVEHGVATEQEIDIDTLGERLLQERVAANATYIGDMVFGLVARKQPGDSSSQ